MTDKTNEKKRPTHAIYQVRGEKEKSFWTRIGSAWPNKNGNGFQLMFDAFPLNGRIQLREITEKTGDEASAA
ncbi:hypothetical protein IVB46_41830 [Bradyrhizobium sp. 61]|uniref:hypothetical protein n=1 Tax=Bradyrhizobium sp. 61 TaxID=2782679 RepID=UPI001FFAC22B|nr:hypothetical protein [Bradyrhizobium sp. 61]MCK1281775.1 hypothetical protein [Bradyrhizobium sp. 61]